MILQTSLPEQIVSYSKNQSIVSISGKSGLGKTTLALQLVGHLLTKGDPISGQCVWVQASEIFPIRRLRSLFAREQKRLGYLQKNILVYPVHNPFKDYHAQKLGLESLSEQVFPPRLRVIVIDNVSHHLRYYLMQQEAMSVRSKVLDEFYALQLFPLLMRCQRESITLTLIHEMSYSVKDQAVRPFFAQLYERLDMVSVILFRSATNGVKTVELTNSIDKGSIRWEYEISREGFELI